MSIPDDKERFTFVIDKNIKAKLQILADRKNRKLGNYVANILYEHIQDIEGDMVKKYGDEEFHIVHRQIFGELEPEKINSYGLVFFFKDDPVTPNESTRKITIKQDGLFGHVAEQQNKYDIKKDPTEK